MTFDQIQLPHFIRALGETAREENFLTRWRRHFFPNIIILHGKSKTFSIQISQSYDENLRSIFCFQFLFRERVTLDRRRRSYRYLKTVRYWTKRLKVKIPNVTCSEINIIFNVYTMTSANKVILKCCLHNSYEKRKKQNKNVFRSA